MRDRTVRVMLVEDNADHAEMVIRQLEAHHIANLLIHLSDGQAALDYLYGRDQFVDSAKYPQPDVILLDLRLPKVDGLEVLRILKEDSSLRRIPVVVLTTSNAERDVAQAYSRHANSYLVKPVDFEQFRQLMIDLGEYWMQWNKRVE
ncbi:MAG: response regulator [Anaerolineae bacterium]|nr:response regulator [Anaerolineae bacterium]MCA9911423.1 response regulator [Anaerolineae bacterium]